MSSSSQIVRYGSTALAAGGLHSDMVVHGKKELRQISKILPPGAEAVVQFFVTADLSLSASGSRSREPQIYRAATAHFKTTADNKLVVSATIGVYITGAYQERVVSLQELEASPSPAIESLASNAVIEVCSREVEVLRHPLISEENEEKLKEMHASERCPQALTIMRLVKEMFKDGVPLPGDQRFHYCTFTVMFRIPSERIQYLAVLRGTRGVKDPRTLSSSTWHSTGVKDVTYGSNGKVEQQEEELETRFKDLRLQACSGARPSSIPDEARQIDSLTRNGVMPAISAVRSTKIEEVLK